jgi:hypothetical protein
MEAVRQEMKENNQHFLQELEERMKNHCSAPDEDATVKVISLDRVRSSYGSTLLPLNDACLTFPVDKITEPIPCNLYVQEKFYKAKVVQGLAYPCGEAGDVLQNHMLIVGYSKVTTDAVTKTRYRAVELDYPEDEDRKILGENLGCQVFWCKRYISFGSDSKSDDDMDDEDSEDSHQYREPSISSPLQPKTHKTGPSTRTTTQPSQNLQENTSIEEPL